jgi:hypothetical protein
MGLPAVLISGIISNAWLAWKAARRSVMSILGIAEPFERAMRRLAKRVGFPKDRILEHTALATTLRIERLLRAPRDRPRES